MSAEKSRGLPTPSWSRSKEVVKRIGQINGQTKWSKQARAEEVAADVGREEPGVAHPLLEPVKRAVKINGQTKRSN